MYVEIIIGDRELKRGKIKRIISKEKRKDGMVKVELITGEQGRVVKILTRDDFELENFKFFNLFFHSKEHYIIYNSKKRENLVITKERKGLEVKHFIIFSDKKLAESVLQRSHYIKKGYNIRTLNKNLSSYINKLEADLIILNMERTVLKKKFFELEERFKKM